VELSFSTPQLREICERREAAIAALGESVALELEERLADIDALDTVADLSSMFPGDVIDRTPEERSITLKAGAHLVFRAGHVRTPVDSASATDWSKVSRIRVVGIESDR
jgi:hypothetical protein